MTKKKMQTIKYNESHDTYELWITDHEGEWVFTSSWQCMGKDRELVHYSLITTLKHNLELGYQLV